MKRLFFILNFFVFYKVCLVKCEVLFVVSFDGFRNEFLTRNITPHFNQLRAEGSSVPFLKNIFPTKTFPEHFAIATGLNAKHHGVVNNFFYDKLKGPLRYGDEFFHYSNRSMPIWVLNEKNGGVSGCIMFPSSDFQFHNKSCTYLEKFGPESYEKRVEQAFKWILDPKKPANLIMMYINDPDETAHVYGIDSNEITEKIKKVDSVLGLIREGIRIHHLENVVNLIVLSDHGMAQVSPKNFIDLTQVTGNDTCSFYGTSPIMQVVPKPEKMDFVLTALKNFSKTNGHFKVFTNDELPEEWDYRNDQRVGPITVLADKEYAFQDMWSHLEFYKKTYNLSVTDKSKFGVHGYLTSDPDMRAIFMAIGPSLKEKFVAEPFYNIDLYHLFCKLLNLNIHKDLDGDPKRIEQLLRESNSTARKRRIPVIILTLMLLCSITFALAWLIIRRRRNRASLETNLEEGEASEKLLSSGDDIPESAEV